MALHPRNEQQQPTEKKDTNKQTMKRRLKVNCLVKRKTTIQEY